MEELSTVQRLRNLLTKDVSATVQETSRQIITFGVIMFINYPFYYLVWYSGSHQSYENLGLRLFASFLCFFLILHKQWPRFLKKYLPLYWYFTTAFCLPFFFTFMTLENNASTMWLMNCMSALFFLFLLFDVLSTSIILAISIPLGFMFYLYTPHHPFDYIAGTVNLTGIVSTFGAAFVIGAIFSHNNEIVNNEKLRTLTAFGDMIAHEMRTPLVSINMIGINLKRWLGPLLETYEIASQQQLEIPYIDKRVRNKLPDSAASIEMESSQAQQIINMLLANIEGKKTISSQLGVCHIATLVNKALERYAFDLSDRTLIKFDPSSDFELRANDFFINVIFNLIKNSLHQIKAADRGEITIWATEGEKHNELHFKDSANGISKKRLATLFKPFISDTRHGTGLGLAFCKMVMESYGGSIRCESKEGEYAEFIMSFPKFQKT